MQKEHRIRISDLFVAASGIFTILLAGCATTMNLPSHWPEKPITIDGKNIEWEHTYLVDNNRLVVSFDNDSSFVYLLLATNDRPLTMSMMRGLTVWFDPKGSNNETFGIHYPLGGKSMHEGSGNGREGDEQSVEPMEQFGLQPTEMEILGPEKEDHHRMQIMETGGIQARYNLSVNSFVYELKVPFSMGDKFPFAIHAKLGDVIGLGLETSKGRIQPSKQGRGERHNEGDASGQGDAGGNEGGYDDGGLRGGGRGGRRGSFGQAGARGAVSPLDLWMKVQLVQKDTLAQ